VVSWCRGVVVCGVVASCGGCGGGCDGDGLNKGRGGKSRRKSNTADSPKCRKAETRMEAQRTSLAVLGCSAL
jgi:hypothetical protein